MLSNDVIINLSTLWQIRTLEEFVCSQIALVTSEKLKFQEFKVHDEWICVARGSNLVVQAYDSRKACILKLFLLATCISSRHAALP
jgi:hypothetical protein